LSVMNGFQKEVRDRMLSVVSHIELSAADGQGLPDMDHLLQQVAQHPQVLAAAPFVGQQALIARGEDMRGAQVRGIDPQREVLVADFMQQIPPETLHTLQPDSFNVILGAELASILGVQAGDSVTLVAPGGQVTPAGVLPRLKQLHVSGVFDSGHYEYDATLALMHVQDAQRIFRLESPSGLRLKINNPQDARWVAYELATQLGSDVVVRDWTRQNRSWFAAVQVEKRMMFIILTLIVAVAAFNLVTTW